MCRVAATLALAGCLWGCGGEPADETEGAEAGTPKADVAAGRRLFARNGCQVCHGDEGYGDGKMAAALRPPPPDFRDLSRYRRGTSVQEISEAVRQGISTGRGGMPAYPHLAPEDRQAMARYIVSVQVP